MYLWLSVVTSIIFGILFYSYKDLRREMVWAGLLAIPVFYIKPLISPQFFGEVQNLNYMQYMIGALLFGLSFGGISAVIFEILFHKKMGTVSHPDRVHLNWLIIGPIVFAIFKIVLGTSIALGITAGFLVQSLVLLYFRKDLIWDAITTGIFMGVFYLIFYYLYFLIFPGPTYGLWFSELSGIMVFSMPVEEAISIFAFGMLWGPLYEGVKGYNLKNS